MKTTQINYDNLNMLLDLFGVAKLSSYRRINVFGLGCGFLSEPLQVL